HTTYADQEVEQAMVFAQQALQAQYQRLTANSLPQDIELTAFSPWQRTFEIGLNLKVNRNA
ncbi:hypothetical protein QTO03_24680, partial [Vibrio campbellii]